MAGAKLGTSHSLLALLAANLVALGVSLHQEMALAELMLVYWMQSVAIGITSTIRMARLKEHDKGDPRSNRDAAQGFAIVYFVYHFFFLSLILGEVQVSDSGTGDLVGYVLRALVFLCNHFYSLRHNLRSDAAGRPNVALLFLLPLARIAPMHAIIYAGTAVFASPRVFAAFVCLKIIADLVMHAIEHRVLQSGRYSQR